MIPEEECGLTLSVQAKLLGLFASKPGIDEVILYGSRAKGTFKPGSDIDLTIKSESMTLSDLLKLTNEIDDLYLPYKIDLSLFAQIDNPNLLEHIGRVGVSFFTKS